MSVQLWGFGMALFGDVGPVGSETTESLPSVSLWAGGVAQGRLSWCP